MTKFLPFSLSNVVFIMLITVKLPTMVGILTFMSRINSVNSRSRVAIFFRIKLDFDLIDRLIICLEKRKTKFLHNPSYF